METVQMRALRAATAEQRSQAAFSAKTLRAADLLPTAGVGSAVTARCGDAPASPPWPPPKSLAAGPHGVFKQALTLISVVATQICLVTVSVWMHRTAPSVLRGAACNSIHLRARLNRTE